MGFRLSQFINLNTGKADCAGAFWLENEPVQQILRIDISSCAGSNKSQKAPVQSAFPVV